MKKAGGVTYPRLGVFEYERFVGAPRVTVMFTVPVVKPAAFVAVIVYVAADATAVGVPLITPVVVLSESPVGSAGDTLQEATAPPPIVGEFAVISVPVV